MTIARLSIVATLLFAAASGAAQTPVQNAARTLQLAQVTIEQRVIIRIPALRPRAPSSPPEQHSTAVTRPEPPEAPASFREIKGPKCLKLGQIRGAVINPTSGITMVTDGDEHFRVHFGRMCQAADFYASFYIEPHEDGALCAGRDQLHARNGSNCDIESFSKLVPED